MSDRARLSNLRSWTQSNGSQSLGSKDFPPSLVGAVERFDPAGLLVGIHGRDNYDEVPLGRKKQDLNQQLRALHGKRILSMAGGADKLVPYRCGQPFIQWFQRAVQPTGWSDAATMFEDVVFDGVGHEMSPDMATKASRFMMDSLELLLKDSPSRTSKI